jgi:hypothetical protein
MPRKSERHKNVRQSNCLAITAGHATRILASVTTLAMIVFDSWRASAARCYQRDSLTVAALEALRLIKLGTEDDGHEYEGHVGRQEEEEEEEGQALAPTLDLSTL